MISQRKTGFGLVQAWRGVFERQRRNRKRLSMWRALELFFRRPPETETNPPNLSSTSQLLALTIRAPIYMSMSRYQTFRHLQRVQQSNLRRKAATASGDRGSVSADAPNLFHQRPRANALTVRPGRHTEVRLRQRIRSIIRQLQPRVPTTAKRANALRAAQSVVTDVTRFAPANAAGAIALLRQRVASRLRPAPEWIVESNKPIGRRHALTANRTAPANTLQFAVPRAARRDAPNSKEHHSHHEHRRLLPIEIVYRESKQPPAPAPPVRERRVPFAEMPALDVSRLSSEVMRRITKQVRVERERLGRS